MANKKSKGGKGGKGSGKAGSKPIQKPNKQNDLLKDVQLAPQERVEAVRPVWESLTQQEHVGLLTIDLDDLRQRARQLTEVAKQQQQAAAEVIAEGLDLVAMETSLEEVLDEGVRRLKDKGTWKLWSWVPGGEEFHDAEAFRTFVTETHIRDDLRRLLPRDDPKSPEKPAEAAFRQRMLALLQKVQQTDRPVQEEAPQGRTYRRRHVTDSGLAARDANIELINIMLEGLEKEHDCLYQSLLQPITSYIMEILPEGSRETAKTELAFEDLEKVQPDDAAHIVEWLTEKVDALSTKLKADAKEDEEPEDEEENMGDVDLWSVVNEGKSLTVNEKWLQHLQDRLLGEDGHPRKVKPGEDPHSNGLVLEWVYGSIVSTAEKARDGAKRCLGSYMPMASEAHAVLLRALEDYYIWETRGKQAKDLMADMLKSRLEAQQMAKQYDIQPLHKPAQGEEISNDDPPLPTHVVVAMLRREALLTKAKLHYLIFEHLQQEKAVRTLKAQLRQGEPEFERLKRELDEVKHAHRGLDGTYRSAAEMERHRAQLADAAIEEQLEVQTAFREQGARLQAIYDKKQRSEYEMAKRETEIKQLQGWKGTVENLIDKFQEVLAAMGNPAAATTAQNPEVPERPTTAGDQQDVEMGIKAEESTVAKAEAEAEETAQAAAPDAAQTPAAVAADGDQTEPTQATAGCSPAAAQSSTEEVVPAEPAALKEHWDPDLSPQQCMQLAKLRTHFHKDVRKQLYGDTEDKQFFEWLKQEVKVVDKRLEESRVALQHLEMHLINTACDDPGATIGMQLALPILQERLDAKALEFAAARAKMAESEIIEMELEQQVREAAERERKLKAKQSKKDKVRSEREKALAEKAAKEAAEEERRAEEEARRRQAEEEERQRRLEQMEQLRREEEEHMERRRQELLSDENGYWRRRMEAEAKAARVVAPQPQVEEEPEPATQEESSAPASSETQEEVDATTDGFMAGKRRRKREQQDVQPANNSLLRGKDATSNGGRHANDADTRGGDQELHGHGENGSKSSSRPRGRVLVVDMAAMAAGKAAPVSASQVPASQPTSTGSGSAAPAPPAPPPVPAPAPTAAAPSKPAADQQSAAQGQAAPAQPSSHSVNTAANAGSAAPAHDGGPTRQRAVEKEVPQPQQPSGPPASLSKATEKTANGSLPVAAAASAAAAMQPAVAALQPHLAPAPAPNLQQLPAAPVVVVPMQPHVSHGHMPGVAVIHGGPPPAMIAMPHSTAAPGTPPSGHSSGRPPAPPQLTPMPPAHGPHVMQQPMMGVPHGMMAGPRPGMPSHGMVAHPAMPQGSAGGPVMPMGPGVVVSPRSQGMPQPMQQPMVMPMSGPYHPHMMPGAHGAMLVPGPNGLMAPAPMFMYQHGGQPIGGMMHAQHGMMNMHPGPPHGPAPLPPGPPGPHMAQQSQQPQAMSPRAGNAEGNKPGGKPVALSVGAKPFIPSMMRLPQQQQQMHLPQMQVMQPMPYGLHIHNQMHPQAQAQAATFYRQQQQQQQHMMMSMYNQQQHQQQQQQPYSGTQPRSSRAARRDGKVPQQQQQAPGAATEQQGHYGSALPNGAASVRTSGQGNGGKPMAQDFAIGCSPLSPLTPLDTAEASDSSHTTSDEQQAEEAQSTGMEHMAADAPADSPTSAATPAGGQAGDEGAAASSQQEAPTDGSSVSASTCQPEVCSTPAPAKSAAASEVSTNPSLSKHGSWSSVVADADQSPAQLSPPSSSANLAALGTGAGTGAGATWKQKLQKNMQQQQQPVAQQKPGRQAAAVAPQPRSLTVPAPPAPMKAGSRTSAQLMSKPAKPLPGVLQRLPAGRVAFVAGARGAAGSPAVPQTLKLARGLLNRDTQNNCFLNVIIQSLWHFACFREPILQLSLEAVEAKASAPKDKRVMSVIWKIFQEMSQSPDDKQPAGSTISPQELREALSSQSTVHIDPSDMQDASEVFAEILSILHRADLGKPAEEAADLQLPVRVKVRSSQEAWPASASSTAYAAAVTGPSSAVPVVPATLVHRIFGLDVHLPCPVDDEDEDNAADAKKGGRKKGAGQLPAAAAAGNSSSGGAAGASTAGAVPKKVKEPGVMEVHQFTKFFHLVPAQSLRQAHGMRPAASFEELLSEVDASGHKGQPQPCTTLLRRPSVFTLAVVWESPQAPADAIRGTVEALGSEVELSEVFKMQSSGPLYRLRCVLCYFGHHYQVYALSEELNMWLLFDDEEIQLVGQWADVCRAMVVNRSQPSLLFYEDSSVQARSAGH